MSDPKQIIVTTEVLDAGEVAVYETFDEAYTALMAQLEPGGSIFLHSEECALVDGADAECDCSPLVLTSGAQA